MSTEPAAESLPLVHKACACVFRGGAKGALQILVFAHPLAGWQLPKGTVEPNEALDIAALRELREESGLSQSRVVAPIGVFDRQTGGGPEGLGAPEIHRWHLFHVEAETTQEAWTHAAEGSPEEDGLLFSYFWFNVFDSSLAEFHPVWTQPFALIRAYGQSLPN